MRSLRIDDQGSLLIDRETGGNRLLRLMLDIRFGLESSLPHL